MVITVILWQIKSLLHHTKCIINYLRSCVYRIVIERTKRNFNYEDRDQINPYQAKDYAKNYE